MVAKCPHCEAQIMRLNLVEVSSSAFMGREWRTIIYTCPTCQKALSTSIDPIAIKTDIINALAKNRI